MKREFKVRIESGLVKVFERPLAPIEPWEYVWAICWDGSIEDFQHIQIEGWTK